ncbi:hypothetical protein MPSEU_000829800 [Mayamaea pseudoterrestris]|nr:hypothetical protein MPSEU_000829800 [Mayamaea pseudoterrestris]
MLLSDNHRKSRRSYWSSYSWNAGKRQLDRRRVLNQIMTTTTAQVMTLLPSNAADYYTSTSASASLPVGLLETRVTENVLSEPPYGMEASDVYYPERMAGTWKVASNTTSVLAPCGLALFGGNVTYQKALSEIGTTLEYTSRFVPVSTGSDEMKYCIADREFNIGSIAKAALGINSLINVNLVSPNKFSCILAPTGSPNLLQVDLITLNRRQETVSDSRFDCSEVVREIVSTLDSKGNVVMNGNTQRRPLLKEIETTSLYTLNDDANSFTCRQRSAAFLLPSQNDPMALKMWEAARGRPVDVRYYEIVYTKK